MAEFHDVALGQAGHGPFSGGAERVNLRYPTRDHQRTSHSAERRLCAPVTGVPTTL